ncbi:MAG: adenosylmethionine decarboxylase [Candidatus Micrarchaeota archaeon]|nr:adenosylmethionine decarboxylase [Candidatus Micrarchaeota archaeon]
MDSKEIQKEVKDSVKIFGRHVYGNLYGVKREYLMDPNLLSKTISECASVGNMHIVELVTRKFDRYLGAEGGVSVIALIEESHMTIHTWPEGEYATIDIYSCGEASDPEKAFKYITSVLKPKTFKLFKVDRGTTRAR